MPFKYLFSTYPIAMTSEEFRSVTKLLTRVFSTGCMTYVNKQSVSSILVTRESLDYLHLEGQVHGRLGLQTATTVSLLKHEQQCVE